MIQRDPKTDESRGVFDLAPWIASRGVLLPTAEVGSDGGLASSRSSLVAGSIVPLTRRRQGVPPCRGWTGCGPHALLHMNDMRRVGLEDERYRF